MSNRDGADLKPWQYPSKWFREEKFWFDMTTRTLSALVAAGVIGLVAIASGFGTHEQRIGFLRVIAITTGFTLYSVAYIWLKMKRSGRFSGINVMPYYVVLSVGTHPKLRRESRNRHVLFDYAGVSGAIWRDHRANLEQKLEDLVALDEAQIVKLLGKSRDMKLYYLPDPTDTEENKDVVDKINGVHYRRCHYIEVTKEEWEAADRAGDLR